MPPSSHLPNVIVFGASGFLGPAILSALDGRARVVAGGRDLVDVSDRRAVNDLLAEVGPDAVINAAAAGTGQDVAEQDAVNVDGAGIVAAASGGTRLVHVSTDVVHDGTGAPYADDATPTPLGSYGTSKAEGEGAVARLHPGAAIVRPSLVWDPARIDPPTAGFADRLRAGMTLTLWDDVMRQPVLAGDLARLLVLLALDARNVSGTLNAGGIDILSRAEFGILLLAHFDVAGRDRVTTAPAPTGVPRDLRLRTDAATSLGMGFRGVHDALARGACRG